MKPFIPRDGFADVVRACAMYTGLETPQDCCECGVEVMEAEGWGVTVYVQACTKRDGAPVPIFERYYKMDPIGGTIGVEIRFDDFDSYMDRTEGLASPYMRAIAYLNKKIQPLFDSEWVPARAAIAKLCSVS